MAVTGFFLFLFVAAHLAGNLQVFIGRDSINRYGDFLQKNLEVLWPARVILITFLLLHIWAAAKLSLENKAARPVSYGAYQPVGSTYASRTMLMSGTIIFIFVIYHLLHYTAELTYINLTGRNFATFIDPQGRHDIFKMLVVGFSNPIVSGFYILGIALLCLHLSHGLSSMFQSLGWRSEIYRPFLERAGRVFAWLIFLGYVSIPIAILFGYGKWVLTTP